MSASEGRDPYEDYLQINKELETYNLRLMERPQIIVANKMDMPGAEENLKEFKEKLECDIEGIYIETDRCSVNEEELDFSGIYIGEIKIRKMK